MSRVCIDATFFLGLNSTNETERIATKNFFVEHLDTEIYMSYEQVAFCDNVIWTYGHDKQSLYFPFMDYFMAEAKMIRKPYSEGTFQMVEQDETLSFSERLTCAFAREHDGVLYTWNRKIINAGKLQFGDLPKSLNKEELAFPDKMEHLYLQSLGMTTCIEDLY